MFFSLGFLCLWGGYCRGAVELSRLDASSGLLPDIPVSPLCTVSATRRCRDDDAKDCVPDCLDNYTRALVIVSQRYRSQLKYVRLERIAHHSAHLFDIFPILESSKDHQQFVKNKCDHEGNVDGLVLAKVSIGENMVPVYWGGQNKESTRKCCQMGREALSLLMIRQWSNL